MSDKRQKFRLLIFLLVFFSSIPAFADIPVSREAQKEISSQSESFQDQTSKAPVNEEVKTTIIAGQAKEPAEAKVAGPKFTLKKITLAGNTIFKTQELEKYYTAYLGRTITMDDLKVIAEAITSHYRAAGYSLCKAYLLPQKIENGAVTLTVIEGKIRSVLVEGNKYFSSKLFTQSIHPRKDRIFQYQALENDLYFLNQKPDRSASAYLVPTDKTDTFDLALKAKDAFPVHAYYTFSNNGTKLTRRQRHTLEMTHNNLTGRGDTLTATYSFAEEGALGAGSAGYWLPLEGTGRTFNLNTSYVKTHLIGPLKSANIVGSSFNFSPGLTQNIYRTPLESFDVFVGFEYKDSKTNLDGARVNFDRMRVLQAGPRWSKHDKMGRTGASADIHLGIPGFLGGLKSVDSLATQPNSGGQFTYYTVDVTRLQLLPFSSYLTLRGSAQWTDDNLTSAEQFRAGGAYSVRGYPESDSAGDCGLLGSAELNLPVFFLPARPIPFTRSTWLQALRLVTFVDTAKTFSRDKLVETTAKDRYLLGSGLGIRLNIEDNLALRCDLGFPLGEESTDGSQHPQVHFSARGGF